MDYFVFKFIAIVSMYFAQAEVDKIQDAKWHTENRKVVECEFVGPLQYGQSRDCRYNESIIF